VTIPGTPTLGHLGENLGAVDVDLTDSDLARLEPLPPAFGGTATPQPEWRRWTDRDRCP
jgi:diketogulonate reductase-like aldo/keto reductase